MNFNSHTDVVIRVAVDLVNLLTPGEDRGRRYAAAGGRRADGGGRRAAAWRRRARGDLGGGPAGSAVVAAELRDVFEAVSGGAVDDAARQVNALLIRTGARPELERHDGESWHLHFHAADRSLPNGWAAGCATGLAVVLGGEYDRLGVCTAPRCDRVYVDTSRNGSRRFCSTSCQNRVKAAAFRARLS